MLGKLAYYTAIVLEIMLAQFYPSKPVTWLPPPLRTEGLGLSNRAEKRLNNRATKQKNAQICQRFQMQTFQKKAICIRF